MRHQDEIDRVSPTFEPNRTPLIHQNWLHLGFLHWEVPAADLQAMLPPRLTLDTWEGKAFAGLVPFTVTGVRATLTPPVPFLSAFHEINLRTYVHVDGGEPGVFFFSLDAASVLAVAAARASYHLPYYDAEIEFNVEGQAVPRVEFASRRTDPRGPQPANAKITYGPIEGPTFHAQAGTLEHFLVERYILYAEDGEKQLHRARVHHTPYPLQRAEVSALDETIVWAAGIRRPENLSYAHYASGVSVKVYALEKV